MEMNTPRASYEEAPAEGVRRFAGPQFFFLNRASSVGSLNRPRSPRAQRSHSRRRREESADATPRTSGVPTTFGPDSSDRSRSGRRQRPEEADMEPQGGEDPGEQADFSVDEAAQDHPPEQDLLQEEEGFREDEDIPTYAERINKNSRK
eukprot:1848656-Amphidinium_carterae.1